MKRYLKKDNFQLSDHEKENLWLSIKDGSGKNKMTVPTQRFLRPVLGFATAMAAVLALFIFMDDSQQPMGEIAQVQPQKQAVPMARMNKTRSTERVLESKETVFSIQPEPFSAEVDTLAEVNPETITLVGRIVDKETGAPLAYANVLIEGTDKGFSTDGEGQFKVTEVNPEEKLTLRVKYMGYEDKTASVETRPGKTARLEIAMEPMIVATLEAFDVEAAEYMVEVKSSLKENPIKTESFEKFAIESVKDALAKYAGTPPKTALSPVRGGRSGETNDLIVDDLVSLGSVTGGTTAPNGEEHELMYFNHTGVNPFVATEEDALSTFAIDVDNASYTMARRYINGGSLPPQEAIRVEEFINFFDAGYQQHSKDTFTINIDGAPSRFGDGYQMVRIGLQGKTILSEDRKAANLTFLIDISGSMDQGNRLGLVQSSLRILLDELREGDRVGLVVYGSQAEVRLSPTDISHRDVILKAIDSLHTNGATNAYNGLQMAYRMARENFQSHKLNRIILCSDGVANMGGSTRAEEMLEQIRKASDKGITLSTIGFGMGNYNDVLMEKLADQGDGNYYYVDQLDEARRVFCENLTGLLQTIARQVKVQVEFDKEKVKRWRLLGYENRDIADRDFRNDDVDAGEVGAGHQVTALYEIKLTEEAEGRLGRVHLRYEMPTHDQEKAGQIREINHELTADQLVSKFSKAPARYRLQVVVTEFAEILRGSYWAKDSQLEDLIPLADALAEELAGNENVEELARLIRKAADLQDKK